MPSKPITAPTDDDIRTRSYLLWEREGCQNDKSEEYWIRAKAELEAEAKEHIRDASMASMGGESTDFVLPRLPISTPPDKSVATRLRREDSDLRKAV